MHARVLLIDDEDVVRKITKRMLTAAGYDVVCADGGRNGLALFDLNQPDLVITDIVMPETDGIEVATGDFGPDFSGGLMVVQDGHNLPAAQNFKLVGWDDIKAALGLD